MTIERLQEICKMFKNSGLGFEVIMGAMLAHMEMTKTLEDFIEKFPEFVKNEKRRN